MADAKPPPALPYDRAILCEGDSVGYEVQLLKGWIDRQVGTTPLVGVFACGTGDALFGVSDAVGRSLPVMVMEDRDFRSVDDAARDSKEKAKDRRKRAIRLLDWRTWHRNEIENYFLDDDVLLPVFSEVFDCEQADVKSALAEAVRDLAVPQAIDRAFYLVRKSWYDKTRPEQTSRASRISWKRKSPSTGQVPWVADVPEAELGLHGVIQKWRDTVYKGGAFQDPFADDLLEHFRQSHSKTAIASVDDADWRTDWAGKEVLQYVRRRLAASKAGWWSVGPDKSRPVDWTAFKNTGAMNAHDRSIEKTIQPRLVRALVHRISEERPDDPVRREFLEIAEAIRRPEAPQE